MAANTQPIFTLTPNLGMARSSTASATRDGSVTASIAIGLTAGINGTRIDRISITSATLAIGVISSAMVARIYLSDVTGANYRLYKEIAMSATLPTATAVGVNATLNISGGLIIRSGQQIGCGQSLYNGPQDQLDFIIEGGDY